MRGAVIAAIPADVAASIQLEDIAGNDGCLFVRSGVGVATAGCAALVSADEVVAELASIPIQGNGRPLAIGQLPFEPDGHSEFLIPELAVMATAEGAMHACLIGDDPTEAQALQAVQRLLGAHQRPRPKAAAYTIAADAATDVYLAAVSAAVDACRSGQIDKAVIARAIHVDSSQPIEPYAVIMRLKQAFAASYRFSFDGFIGASPELLVEIDGSTVRSLPLAGTTARTGDPVVDDRLANELLASAKNQREHRIVIDDVHDRLLPWASYLDWEPTPSIVPAASVQHLGTRMEGQLSRPRPDVVTVARALCPTPALGGHPRSAALDLIRRVEGFERGRYGGAVGWVNASGDGVFAVSIRCAQLGADRQRATLFAGGGIVADSEPLAELAETQAKLQSMLAAIIRP